jgi:ribonucleoside-diphosphate reductase alpha chain
MTKVNINLENDELFDDLGLNRLRESYMRDDEVSPQERFAFVAEQFATDAEHAQKIYDYASKHWLSFSTPILSYGRSNKGLPISCFLSYLDDSAEGLVNTYGEVSWLSMLGGGVGIHVGIRGADEKSVGVMPHLKTYDAGSLAYRQGRTRRGSYAAFLDIDHPDIITFMEMRKPTGDPNFRTMNLHHGINISNKFMELVEACMRDRNLDDSWPLINPNNGKVTETVSARDLWMKILELRMHTGEPYLVFLDTANDAMPEWLKALGLKINGSNLCTEIFLPTDTKRSAVCCLSSLNVEYYDLWSKDPEFIPAIMEFLDNVLQHFIDNAPQHVHRAVYSAMRERSIGIGTLGLHAYFQKKNIPLDCAMAKVMNKQIYTHIADQCSKGDAILFEKRGACPDAYEVGVNRRFSHWTAIAPNASSSLIMGNTSPSIEPYRANVFRQDTLSGAYIQKNKFLKKALADLGMDNQKTWASITGNDGSVQHLDIPEDIKEVFKTAIEIDQRWLVDLAADRQPYIDQGQSLNLFFRPDVNVKYLHACHFLAWKQGLKSLYYCRSDKLRKADKVGMQIERKRLEDEIDLTAVADGDVCLACEG